jgi:hypothetical protein
VRRRGSSSLTEGERGLGVGSAVGGEGAGVGVFGVRAEGEAAMAFGAGGASRGISRPSGGGSTICAVELKYRARFGRRKVGGNADAGIRMSRMDLRSDLLNILVMPAMSRQLSVITIVKLAALTSDIK